MIKFIPLFWLSVLGASAALELKEQSNSISVVLDGKTLWTYNHDPAEGKPYFHPLASVDGTVFTELRPEDHPWHRGVWFSWKYINGVNYWEEDRATGKSAGETRLLSIQRAIQPDSSVQLALQLEYAPRGTAEVVLREQRTLAISAPEDDGTYALDWTSTFTAATDLTLDRTPIPGEPGGKSWGGYAGWSVRMNAAMTKGVFENSAGITGMDSHGAASPWMLFRGPATGSMLFMDHPQNVSFPTKWYVSQGMGYMSPAVIHDNPLSLKQGETLTLTYRLVVSPTSLAAEDATQAWNAWTRKKVVLLTGANNHDWKATTPVLESILEGTGAFEVNVVTDPEQLTPAFLAEYDVLLSNWNAFGTPKPAPWSEALKAAYVEFVRSGGGHVVVHAGSASFFDWRAYQAICLATWKGETGHKKPHEFAVRITQEKHPVTCGCEDFKTLDELWFKPFVESEATVLAESYSRHTGNWEPTAFVGQFGEGRCYTLLLGHAADFMQNSADFQNLLIRGTSWAAGE